MTKMANHAKSKVNAKLEKLEQSLHQPTPSLYQLAYVLLK